MSATLTSGSHDCIGGMLLNADLMLVLLSGAGGLLMSTRVTGCGHGHETNSSKNLSRVRAGDS